jgi:muramoyltetrapeptide carboxypeptidase
LSATIAIAPPRVRAGDVVAIAAPAGPVREVLFNKGLELLGERFTLRVADDIRRRAGYLAGPDARRIEELNGYLRDPDVRAIVLARGGYGLMRILPELDAAALAADPKPIVGFSDATALLAWADKAGVRGIHGPMINKLSDVRAEDVSQLAHMLVDPAPLGRVAWTMADIGAGGEGVREGRLIPGNLAMFSNLAGTPWQARSDGAIFAIEEIGEKPYAIDRYLTHLHLAGALRGVRAMICGDLVRCNDPILPVDATDDPGPAIAVVDERLRAFGIPGLIGAPIGHGARNASIPWGARCIVDLDASALEILDGAVA